MTNTQAISELRREFARRGWDKKATGPIVFQLMIHIALAIAGTVAFLACHNPLLRGFGIAISAFGCMGVGTNTHTSSHYGTSQKRWVNEALSYLGFPTFLGFSATFWWYKHVVLHHPAPNVMGVDEDADLLPWFAMTVDDINASSGLRRFYYERVQFWAFPLLISMTYFNMVASGWIYLIGALCQPKARKTAHWIDLGAKVLHLALWIGVPLLFFPWPLVVGCYVLRGILVGYAMYFVLGPGHLPAEAQRITAEAKQETDFFTVQTEGTVSFRTGWIGRFLCSGLEFQIEHHLFPNISHIYYPEVSVIVQRFCAEQGLPYRCYSWGTAVWKSWQVMRNPQQVLGHDTGRAVFLELETELRGSAVSSEVETPPLYR